MAPKRPLESEDASRTGAPEAKKPRKGFRVGPDNLPDGPWRRKVTKIKKDLIQKAKLKKAYKKVKERELQSNPSSQPKGLEGEEGGPLEEEDGQQNGADEAEAEPEAAVHPDRQAILDDDSEPIEPETTVAETRPPPKFKKPRLTGANRDSPMPDQPRQPRDNPVSEKSSKQSRNKPHKPGYYDKALTEASKKKAEQDAREAEFQRRTEERERRNAERERFGRAMRKARAPGRDGQRKLGRESGLLLEKVRRMKQQQ